jgi:hypothetical protein
MRQSSHLYKIVRIANMVQCACKTLLEKTLFSRPVRFSKAKSNMVSNVGYRILLEFAMQTLIKIEINIFT